MKLVVLSLLALLISCGESPLLNHKMEGKNFLRNPVFAESESLKFKKTDYSFIISWQEGPELGESRFVLKTWKKDLGTLNGPYQDLEHQLHVFLWMTSMGHGSAPVKLKKIADGEYEVSNVQFIMGGKWEIKFQLKKDNQVFDETIISLTL